MKKSLAVVHCGGRLACPSILWFREIVALATELLWVWKSKSWEFLVSGDVDIFVKPHFIGSLTNGGRRGVSRLSMHRDVAEPLCYMPGFSDSMTSFTKWRYVGECRWRQPNSKAENQLVGRDVCQLLQACRVASEQNGLFSEWILNGLWSTSSRMAPDEFCTLIGSVVWPGLCRLGRTEPLSLHERRSNWRRVVSHSWEWGTCNPGKKQS
jgi:hypothetical protein